MQISSRFNQKLYFYLLLASICSFVFSLFLLQLFVGALSILWLMEKFSEKKKALGIIAAAVFIFLLARAASIIFSNFPADSSQSYYKEVLFYFGFFSFDFYLKLLDKKRITIIIYTFVIAAVLVSISGLSLFNLHLVDRARSFSSGYAVFSSHLVVAFGILLCVPFNTKKSAVNKFSFLKILSLSFIFTGVITSLGRTNIIIVILLLAASVIIKKVSLKESALVILITVFLSILSFLNNSPEFGRRYHEPADLSNRNVLLKGAEDLFVKFEHPLLGYGPRTFKKIFPYMDMLSDKQIGAWHNDFIQIYFEGGFIGIIAFLILLFIPYLVMIKFIRGSLDETFRNFTIGILFGLSGLILSALTAGFIDSPVLSIVFAFLISLISAINFIWQRNKFQNGE